MILSEIIASFVDHRQAIGMHFRTEARTLKSFCRFVGDRPLSEVTADQVLAFLSGRGPVTRFWERKHSVLAGFYRFAMARGHTGRWPLPRTVPKPRTAFVPYIYSREEIGRLLRAVALIDHPRCPMDPDTHRTLLLLLYGAGLRLGEALALTLADVDLEEGVLCVRESKFYKTRLAPIGQDLMRILSRHASHRHGGRFAPESLLFVTRQGAPVTRQHAERAFCRLRVKANVVCAGAGPRRQPRLHDLRHSFAVHRLIAWYRQGADVQQLLPKLSTYLGHVNISGTQRYLSLTPDLLREASARFEHYAMEAPNA
jgi:site-specific recombinase XerD